ISNPPVFKRKIKDLLQRLHLYGFYKRVHGYEEQRLYHVVEQLGLPKERITRIDHHTCHASAAYYGIPQDEPSLIFTCDGGGDDVCATVSIGDGQITRIATTPKGHSIGNLYSRTTLVMGMKPWEHEWKLMGLASYAHEYGVKKAMKVFSQFIDIADQNPLMFQNLTDTPSQEFYPLVREKTEGLRFDWIAGAVQRTTENLLTRWVRNAIEVTGIHKIVCGGGVFMNIKANMDIAQLPEVNDISVFPSCGDESLAMGAAWYLYHKLTGESVDPLSDLYLGPQFSEQEYRDALSHELYTLTHHTCIEAVIADHLAKGDVVANFQGRMEWGARALGNRSILANPSIRDMVKELNERIKYRTWWMPFTFSVLEEDAEKYLVNPKKIDAPYMIMAFDTHALAEEDLIAAIHPYDLTARPQIVKKATNPRYYRIINEFKKRTGVGAVLNTSFNLHGDPIVCTVDDALSTFKASGLRYLALGNYFVEK
ncbi:MAG: carbamoyltransferase C-terminal domain-containing protein, partial [Pseudomonadota bacterium]|nr:carbamoyltransferase C-terminal domain-containing protein [Pseudomonadota bacterium]